MIYKKIQKPNCDWFHLSDGENIIYCEPMYSNIKPAEMFKISTVHKPCRECGTGFRLSDGEKLTSERINHYLGVIAPIWAKNYQIEAVKKYKNIDDFISSDSFRSDSIISDIEIE